MFRFLAIRGGVGSSRRRALATYTNLSTVSKPVEFPPPGTKPYFVLSVLALTYCASEISQFLQSRDHIEEVARKAKAGEGFFPPSQVTRALLELNAYATEYEKDLLGPSNIPRILSLGGKEAIIQALESDNASVFNAAAELARTVTAVSPTTAQRLMRDEPRFAHALFASLDRAADLNSRLPESALDFHNADVVLPNLLSTLANCVEYYEVGRDEHLDSLLLGALRKLTDQTLAATQRRLDHHSTLPPSFNSLDALLDDSASLNHQAWLLLVMLKSPTVVGRDFLERYEPLAQHEVFENDKQQMLYLLALFDYWQQHRITNHASLPEEKSWLFYSKWGRQLLRRFLNEEDVVTSVVSSLLFGQVWGALRTLFALRNVAAPAGEHALLWRWKMASRFGLTAGLGALAVTLLSQAMKREVSVEQDSKQVAVFTTKIVGGLLVVGMVFRLCPYFLVPAVLADAFLNAEGEGGYYGFEYVRDRSPFAPKSGAGDGTEWT
ncbi:hypothetical protein BASA81_015167 [Batrachochytrium salamandrivorans]|nr:hypothetical protein BASA81_015167 [Batrachochytrium salamandrivorans]